jgi:hypothetical protein
MRLVVEAESLTTITVTWLVFLQSPREEPKEGKNVSASAFGEEMEMG